MNVSPLVVLIELIPEGLQWVMVEEEEEEGEGDSVTWGEGEMEGVVSAGPRREMAETREPEATGEE